MSIHKEHLDSQNIPRHIAVIMDGNGRWARSKGASRIFGHRNAVGAVRNITECCGELGVKYLTLYAFSTENWGRPQEEVNALMDLLVETTHNELNRLLSNHVKLTLLGDKDIIPHKSRNQLLDVVEKTKDNQGLQLQLAISYSGRWEIVQAVKKVVHAVQKNGLDPNTLDEKKFSSFLQTAGIPDPELLIRTGGEQRVSNFLLWQLAYTELYITSTLWPDIKKDDIYAAIGSYQQRERRFGLISSQISTP